MFNNDQPFLLGGSYVMSPEELRERAEAYTRERSPVVPEPAGSSSLEATRRILHELRVHQIELELQNEELRRTQNELQAARIRYVELFDLAPAGYVTLSESGLITEANLAAASMLGVHRSALHGKPFGRYFARDDQDSYYRFSKVFIKSSTTQSAELWMVKHDGTRLRVNVTASGSTDIEGQPILRVILTDVTQRQRDAVATRIREEELQSLLEQSRTGVAQVEITTGRFMAMNDRFSELVGMSRDVLMTLDFRSLSEHGETNGAEFSVDEPHLSDMLARSVVKRFTRSDDSRVWLRMTVSRVWTAGPKAEYAVVIVEPASATHYD